MMSWFSLSSYTPSKKQSAPLHVCSDASPGPVGVCAATQDTAPPDTATTPKAGTADAINTPHPDDGSSQKSTSSSIYAWFSLDRKHKPSGPAAVSTPIADRGTANDAGDVPEHRHSSFWFSYSSPSAADTLASLGTNCELPPPPASMVWMSDSKASDEAQSAEGPLLRSFPSGASLDEVTAGEPGKYFSLVECHDVPDHDIKCCSCGCLVTEYIVLAEDGTTWHAKCFATAMCPDDGDSVCDTESTGDSAGLFDSDHETSATEVPSFEQTLPSSEEKTSQLETENNVSDPVLDMAEAISWAVLEDARRFVDMANAISAESPNDNTPVTAKPPLGDAADDKPGGVNELYDRDSSFVCANVLSEDGGIRAPVSVDGGEKMDALLVELHTLGMFKHNYRHPGDRECKSHADLEREADEWTCRVGNAVDRTLGLFTSAIFTSKDKFSGGSRKYPIACVSHAAIVMHCIRLKFGITMPEYASSFVEIEGGEVGEGKSGKRLWYTKDRRFVIKAISYQEFTFLNKIFRSYYSHMISNGSHTLICRFMGLYTITLSNGSLIRVIVMNNVFYHPPNPMAPAAFVVMDELFDLKGSAINRCVTQDDVETGVSVMKDLNFCVNHNGTDTKGRPIYASDGPGVCRKFPLDAAFSAMLRADIENDCAWLAGVGIMDYSLLVGMGHLEFSDCSTGFRNNVVLEMPPPFRTSSFTEKSGSRVSLPHPLCRENSLHSSFQHVAQTVPWSSVWQEHWVRYYFLILCVYGFDLSYL